MSESSHLLVALCYLARQLLHYSLQIGKPYLYFLVTSVQFTRVQFRFCALKLRQAGNMGLDLQCLELLSSATHTLTPQPTSLYLQAHNAPLLLGALTQNLVLTISLGMLCFIAVYV